MIQHSAVLALRKKRARGEWLTPYEEDIANRPLEEDALFDLYGWNLAVKREIENEEN